MAADHSVEAVWLPVIGRTLARICLHIGKYGEKTIAEQAKLLEGLGLPRKDVADMLGTTTASITELLRRAKAKKKGKRKVGTRKKR